MSIALSATVQPSRMGRCVLAVWALAQWGAAVAVLAAPTRYAAPAWLAVALALGGLAIACAGARTSKMHRIDISGTGDLRVTVQQNVRAARSTASFSGAPDAAAPLNITRSGDASGLVVAPRALLSGSVRWPGLMVLRLGAADGAGPEAGEGDALPRVVPVWRDSVDGDTWRALAVALAVIGKPGGQEGGFDQHR